jgi:DNA-binding response OmpR family regulator
MMEVLGRLTVDLLILDWECPDCSGLDLLATIRADARIALISMFYSSHEDPEDTAAAYQAGARDWIIKPVSDEEFAARVLTQLRRAFPAHFGEDLLVIGPHNIDRGAKRWIYHGRDLELTATEFGIALCLLGNLGRPMSRDYIQEFASGESSPSSSRSLDSQVSTIRIKLRLMPERGFQLRSLYGFGYRLDPSPQREAAADGRARMVDWSMITNVQTEN